MGIEDFILGGFFCKKIEASGLVDDFWDEIRSLEEIFLGRMDKWINGFFDR